MDRWKKGLAFGLDNQRRRKGFEEKNGLSGRLNTRRKWWNSKRGLLNYSGKVGEVMINGLLWQLGGLWRFGGHQTVEDRD